MRHYGDHVEIEMLTESDAREYREPWRLFGEHIPRLTDDEKVKAISIIMGLCHDCREEPAGCQCWNDD
jgi:hypothetical protein